MKNYSRQVKKQDWLNLKNASKNHVANFKVKGFHGDFSLKLNEDHKRNNKNITKQGMKQKYDCILENNDRGFNYQSGICLNELKKFQNYTPSNYYRIHLAQNLEDRNNKYLQTVEDPLISDQNSKDEISINMTNIERIKLEKILKNINLILKSNLRNEKNSNKFIQQTAERQ